MTSLKKSLSRSQVVYKSFTLNYAEQEEDPIEEGDALEIPAKEPKIEIKKVENQENSDSFIEEIETANEDDLGDDGGIPSAQNIPVDNEDEIETEFSDHDFDTAHAQKDTAVDDIENKYHDLTDDPVSDISSSQIHRETLPDEVDAGDEIEQNPTQHFLSSDVGEEIDMTGHEEFFREEFIVVRFVEEETDQLDLFDCGQVRVLVCEHLPTDGESNDAVFEKLMCDGMYKIIVDAKKVPKEIQEGSKFIMKLPLFTFAHGQQFGVIAPNFFLAE